MKDLRHARPLVLLLLGVVLLAPAAARAQEKPGPGANLLDLLRERAELKNRISALGDDASAPGQANTPLMRRLILLRLNRQLHAKDKEIIELYKENRHLSSGNVMDDLDDVMANSTKRLEDELKLVAEEVEKELEAVAARVQALRVEVARLSEGATEVAAAAGDGKQKPVVPSTCDKFDAQVRGGKLKLPNGTLMCAEGHKVVDVRDLAKLAAPVLWFSPDEPLIERRQGRIEIPGRLKGQDAPEGTPVVYFRVSHIRRAPNVKSEEIKEDFRGNKIDLSRVEGLTLRYYFYYPEDIGFGTHRHDLEFIKMDVGVRRVDDSAKAIPGGRATQQTGNTLVFIEDVYGGAHGVTWYYNWLDISKADDVSLPITVLVEEGKHASSPDRNGDGAYSPGYDVNKRYNDAWGVRDIIGSGELGGSRYQGHMTKRRDSDHRIMVKAEPGERESLLLLYKGPDKEKLLRREPSYELVMIDHERHGKDNLCEELLERDASEVGEQKAKQAVAQASGSPAERARALNAICEEEKSQKGILDLVERERFDQELPDVGKRVGWVGRAAMNSLGASDVEEVGETLTFSYRYDQGSGYSVLPPFGRYEIPALGGYLAPKMNFIFGPERRLSLEGLYTTSASRMVDWYVTAGVEWVRQPGLRRFENRFVSEGGVRFRFKPPRIPLLLFWNKGPRLKLPFLGARVGVRANGRDFRDHRLVFEAGAGAF